MRPISSNIIALLHRGEFRKWATITTVPWKSVSQMCPWRRHKDENIFSSNVNSERFRTGISWQTVA